MQYINMTTTYRNFRFVLPIMAVLIALGGMGMQVCAATTTELSPAITDLFIYDSDGRDISQYREEFRVLNTPSTQIVAIFDRSLRDFSFDASAVKAYEHGTSNQIDIDFDYQGTRKYHGHYAIYLGISGYDEKQTVVFKFHEGAVNRNGATRSHEYATKSINIDFYPLTFIKVDNAFHNSQNGATYTSDSSVPITITFEQLAADIRQGISTSDPVNSINLDASRVSVSSGTVSNFHWDDVRDRATFTIEDPSEGSLSVTLPANSVSDAAGNENKQTQFQMTVDHTPPVPTVTLPNGQYATGTFPVRVDFGEPMRPGLLSPNNIGKVLTILNGHLVDHSAVSDQVYEFTVEPGSNGIRTWVSVQQHAGTDYAGNYNKASGSVMVVMDSTPPVPTVTLPNGKNADTGTFPVTVTFSEPIKEGTFTASDVQVTSGTASNFVYAGRNSFTFDVENAPDGTVTIQVPAGAVTDLAGNPNIQSTSVSVTVNIDNDPPNPTISSSVSSIRYFERLNITVDFDEPLARGTFTAFDITVSNGIVVDFTTADNQTFNVRIMPHPGTLTVNVPAGVATDQAGNSNTASNQLSVTVTR